MMLLAVPLALVALSPFPDMVLTCSLTTSGALSGGEAPSAITLRVTGGEHPRLSQDAGDVARLPVERFTEVRGDPEDAGFSFGGGLEGISFTRDTSVPGRYTVGWAGCDEEANGTFSHCGMFNGGEGFCQVVSSSSSSREVTQ